MTTNKPLTIMQKFLRKEFPIFPGANFIKPAPAHILNKFSYSLLGKGMLSPKLMEIRRDISKLDNLLPSNATRETKEEFLRSIDILVNSDKRSFPKGNFSSFFLVSKELINGSDPSDNGYGEALVSIFSGEQISIISNYLKLLLDPIDSDDLVSKFILVIQEILKIKVDENFRESKFIDNKETHFGNYIFEVLVSGMTKMVKEKNKSTRISNIQKLSIFLTSAVALGMLYEANLKNLGTKNSPAPNEILGIFCYTNFPPGNPRSVLTKLAQASLKDAIFKSYSGCMNTFESIFKNVNKTSDIENIVLQRIQGEPSRDLIKIIGNNKTPDELKEVFASTVTLSDYSSAFRTLSHKIGLVGPVKGTGEKRMMFETSFLEVLVYFLSQEGDTFNDFVNNCYSKLGLVVGKPENITNETIDKLTKLARRNADIHECLEESHEFLRQRLVISGLAREFSDGFTIMGQS
jgi:hypothetical protein